MLYLLLSLLSIFMNLTEKHSILESHRDKISVIEFWDNGITYIKIDDGCQIEIEDTIAQYEFFKFKADGKIKFLILVESGETTSISKEAREFKSRPENNELAIASAVVVKSLAQRLLINFIIRLQKNKKTKMFDNKHKAIEWLLSFK